MKLSLPCSGRGVDGDAQSRGHGLRDCRRRGRVRGQVSQCRLVGGRGGGGVVDRVAVRQSPRDAPDELRRQVDAAGDWVGHPPLIALDEVLQGALGGGGIVGDLAQHLGVHAGASQAVEYLRIVAERSALKYEMGGSGALEQVWVCVVGEVGHGSSLRVCGRLWIRRKWAQRSSRRTTGRWGSAELSDRIVRRLQDRSRRVSGRTVPPVPTRARRPSQRDSPAALTGRIVRSYKRSSILTEMGRAVI